VEEAPFIALNLEALYHSREVQSRAIVGWQEHAAAECRQKRYKYTKVGLNLLLPLLWNLCQHRPHQP